MHEEAVPILRAGEAAVSAESTPTISQSPWRRASRNSATVAGVEQIARHVRALSR